MFNIVLTSSLVTWISFPCSSFTSMYNSDYCWKFTRHFHTCHLKRVGIYIFPDVHEWRVNQRTPRASECGDNVFDERLPKVIISFLKPQTRLQVLLNKILNIEALKTWFLFYDYNKYTRGLKCFIRGIFSSRKMRVRMNYVHYSFFKYHFSLGSFEKLLGSLLLPHERCRVCVVMGPATTTDKL